MSLQTERRDGVMNERLEDLTTALSDAGCGSDAIDKAKRLWAAGRTEDLIRHLRMCRCELMDDLHECQKRVDCLDYLIRQTKTITTK